MNEWPPSCLQQLKITLTGREWIHFMHVSKTGGTAVKTAIVGKTLTRNYALVLHGHHWTLRDLPPNQRVVFFMRHPVTRYVSAFYSRLRQGRPRYNNLWSDGEERAFAKFTHPSDLAEALSSPHDEIKSDAIEAMRNIGHVRSFVSRWLISPEYLQSKIEQIAFIGFQDHLELDFQKFKTCFGLPADLVLPTTDIETHRTPLHLDKTLSDLAKWNLETWYKEDFILYEMCRKISSASF